MADEENKELSEPDRESRAQENEEDRTEATPLVDEYGEPLADEHEHVRKRPLYRRPAFLIGASLILLLAILFGVRYWAYARSHETTDDAFIDGHIVQVSPKVSGYVVKVYVSDNQTVNAGDLIAELDARDLQAKVAQAKAVRADADVQRYQTLFEKDEVSRQRLDQAIATARTANAQVDAAREKVAAMEAQITEARAATSAQASNAQRSEAQVGAARA